jgi:hypothetical protein
MKDLDLKQLKAKVDEDLKKLSEIKADDFNDKMDCLRCEVEYLYSAIRNMYAYTSQVEQAFYNYIYEHKEGHLPKIQGADKMKNALEALGLDADYEVVKPVIFANTKKGLQATLTFQKKK